jgi:hypothetical protein
MLDIDRCSDIKFPLSQEARGNELRNQGNPQNLEEILGLFKEKIKVGRSRGVELIRRAI